MGTDTAQDALLEQTAMTMTSQKQQTARPDPRALREAAVAEEEAVEVAAVAEELALLMYATWNGNAESGCNAQMDTKPGNAIS